MLSTNVCYLLQGFSSDGEPEASMGNLFLCLTFLAIKKFFLASNLFPSGSDFSSSLVDFSLRTIEKSLFLIISVIFNTLAECYHPSPYSPANQTPLFFSIFLCCFLDFHFLVFLSFFSFFPLLCILFAWATSWSLSHKSAFQSSSPVKANP